MKTNYVAGFLFSPSQDRVALIRKLKPDWQKGKLNAIGGKKGDHDTDETWHQAMTREFLEETGVTIPPDLWQHTVTLHNPRFECRFFRAFSDQVDDVRPMEEEQVVVLPVMEALTHPIIPNLLWLIPFQLDLGLSCPVTIRDGFERGGGIKVPK